MALRVIRLRELESADGILNVEEFHNLIYSMPDSDHFLVVDGRESGCDELVNRISRHYDRLGDDLDFAIVEYAQSSILQNDDFGTSFDINVPPPDEWLSCNFIVRCDIFKKLGGFTFHKFEIHNIKSKHFYACLGVSLAVKRFYYYGVFPDAIRVPAELTIGVSDYINQIIDDWVDKSDSNLDDQHSLEGFKWGEIVYDVVYECLNYLDSMKFVRLHSLNDGIKSKRAVIVTSECVGYISFNSSKVYFSDNRNSSNHIDYTIDENTNIKYCTINTLVHRRDGTRMSMYVTSELSPKLGLSQYFKPDFYVPCDGVPGFLTKAIGAAVYLNAGSIEIHCLYSNINDHVYKLIQVLRNHGFDVITCLYSYSCDS